MKRIAMVILLFCAFSECLASDDIDETTPVPKILAQQEAIREGIVSRRGEWADRSSNEREQVLRKQSRVLELLQGRQHIAELEQEQQLELANLLESIKAAANNAADERKICTRERKMGSNFSTRVCRTAAEMRKLREQTQDAVRKRPMSPRSAGGTQL